MSGPTITRVEASTDVDVYTSWYNAEASSAKKRVTKDHAEKILTAVKDDEWISYKEIDNAYVLLQSLATTRNELSEKIHKGELPFTTENLTRLGRAQMNLNLAQKLYSDMVLGYIDQF